MTDIRFYHLERQSLEQILPSLVTKALSNDHRIIIKTADDAQTQHLNNHLWSFDQNSFLPHGTKKEGHAEHQPVWITSEEENPNNADVLILTGGATTENMKEFTLCCEMLNGNDSEAVTAARAQWKIYKEAGHEITYWQQGAKGWEKKSG